MMQVQIYADVVLVINIFMDFFIFWITSKLCKAKSSMWRIILGSFVSALIYCVLIFVYPFSFFLNIVSGIFIMAAGAFVALRPSDIKQLIKYIFVAHISAFAVGGLAIALFYLTNMKGLASYLGIGERIFPLKILLATTSISYIIIKLYHNRINKKLINKQQFYPVKIYFCGEDISINGLVDTGNSLQEPITSHPVIIVEFESIKKILPNKVNLLFEEQKEDDLLKVLSSVDDTAFANKIRMIPFSSLGKQNGMLIGFKPDKIEVVKNNTAEIINDVVIGICNFKLTQNGEYQALINPELCK